MPEPTRDQRLAVARAFEGVEHEHELCVWELDWVNGKPPRKGTETACESLERLANLLAGAVSDEERPGVFNWELCPHCARPLHFGECATTEADGNRVNGKFYPGEMTEADICARCDQWPCSCAQQKPELG